VTATATIPQLGFIHEDSGQAFALDIADLFRDDITLTIAFSAAKEAMNGTEMVDKICAAGRRSCSMKRRSFPA
jgi:CRISPR-associated protein Cas1